MRMNMMRIPCLNLKESDIFYTEKLGLNKIFGSEDDEFIGYQLDNIQLLLELEEKEEFESGRFLGFSLEVKDMDHFYQKSIELGIIFTGPPEEQVWYGLFSFRL